MRSNSTVFSLFVEKKTEIYKVVL